eukprot:Platyproteum_vivax@DN6541_c0_g1_i1.p1
MSCGVRKQLIACSRLLHSPFYVSSHCLRPFRFQSLSSLQCTVCKRHNVTGPGQTNYWALQEKRTYSEEDLKLWKNEFTSLQPYSSEELSLWRNAFEDMDMDRDGILSRADIQKSKLFSTTKSDVIAAMDKDDNNMVDFGEFVEGMLRIDIKLLRDVYSDFDKVDLQLEFDKYASVDNSNNKVWNLESIKRLMLNSEFMVVTPRDIELLYNDVDKDKDGTITFKDFRNWLKNASE